MKHPVCWKINSKKYFLIATSHSVKMVKISFFCFSVITWSKKDTPEWIEKCSLHTVRTLFGFFQDFDHEMRSNLCESCHKTTTSEETRQERLVSVFLVRHPYRISMWMSMVLRLSGNVKPFKEWLDWIWNLRNKPRGHLTWTITLVDFFGASTAFESGLCNSL